ncbi:hypothetical protein ACIB24_20660 [Spongisporangium articulatum]|uniref:DUF2029 domain-containing protein n=1 Tax=Spongisporangium articulatum TaxID=3362603 RepID=A0ABW8ASV6_9ACTN
MRRNAPPLAALLAPALVVVGMSVATHSVVRYKLWIVAVYTALALGLAAWQLRRPPTSAPSLTATAGGLALAFALAVPLDVRVWAYSYTTLPQREQVRWLFGLVSLVVAVLLLVTLLRARAGQDLRRLPDAALAVAVVGYLIAAVLLIRWSPHPKIDVWVTLQQAADAIPRPQNFYAMNWHDSPGVQDAFTYLPFTALLLAPGRWLAGDVRWALVVITVLGALAVRLLAVRGGRREPGSADPAPRAVVAAAGGAALLLLMPGTATQIEQAWTEPLLLACLAGWALGVHRLDDGRGWSLLAIVCLALGLASKQHLVLLLPLLAVWPRFGWRRTLASAVLGGLFVLPWFLASPADMWHDTVSMLVNFQPLLFADTLYIAAIHELSWTPPFWLTGFLVLGTWVGAALLIQRRQPDLAGVLRWAALVLFVANLVNKQAFYNQFWLVAALVVVSLAVVERPEPRVERSAP